MMGALPSGACGVRILGTGSAVPERRLTNADFARMMDTSDEWIKQRTGISERRVLDLRTEGCSTLAQRALERALVAAGIKATELDFVIVATVTMEMTCPSVACRIAGAIGATNAAAFDLGAACSGFVYALNTAEAMIRAGRARTIAVLGAEAMSSIIDYTDRSVSILFGDAAGCAIIQAVPDSTKGCIYQHMGADGSGWHALYIPRRQSDVPAEDADNPIRLGSLRMNGKEVFRFAVTKFKEVIEDAFKKTNLTPADVSQVICHQSNIRIIDSAREKLNIDPSKIYVNIDRYGNSSAGSVPLCLDELWRDGKITPGKPFMMVAFGGGLTWASSVWNT
ncbi:MAG: ketoacyl-ACP synthase III [Planctomycetota bacterium]|jgi:3-oxoacyl-[acyl-carrier-protein] synthase III|nr:MAG: ketoacyl-ACP synthase III [Planctomycetota bacterium]RLS87195.1 MAG: ketoacyl-ACP synthase III [Planctomycetota bacterium]